MRETFDIVISGAGPAGLIAAAAFGAAGFTVLCLDPAAPVTDGAAPDADLRTTAFLGPAQALMARLGLWNDLAAEAMPLRVMRIVDAAASAPVVRDFVAADIDRGAFGWNVRNWALRAALLSRLSETPGITMRLGTGYAHHVARTGTALVALSDANVVQTRLLIGADGRSSAVRKAAGIGVDVRRYGQKALSFSVTHDAAHDSISTEVHRAGGPFTLVPLPDLEGRPCSAVVWMAPGPEVVRLAALPPAAFSAAATERSAGVLGDLTLATRRQVWPITMQRARALTAERVALVAEAAHAVPPIGAQGLNMSLGDIAALAALAEADPAGLGGPRMLDTYARTRGPELTLRLAGIDALNRASRAGSAPVQALRALGLRALHDVPNVRRAVMRLGLGGTAAPGLAADPPGGVVAAT